MPRNPVSTVSSITSRGPDLTIPEITAPPLDLPEIPTEPKKFLEKAYNSLQAFNKGLHSVVMITVYGNKTKPVKKLQKNTVHQNEHEYHHYHTFLLLFL